MYSLQSFRNQDQKVVQGLERAVYVVEGEVLNGEYSLSSGDMAVIQTGGVESMPASVAARVMIIGGEPFPDKRYI